LERSSAFFCVYLPHLEENLSIKLVALLQSLDAHALELYTKYTDECHKVFKVHSLDLSPFNPNLASFITIKNTKHTPLIVRIPPPHMPPDIYQRTPTHPVLKTPQTSVPLLLMIRLVADAIRTP